MRFEIYGQDGQFLFNPRGMSGIFIPRIGPLMVGTELARVISQKLMKTLTSPIDHDQNWQWPEKTWFRERLNAVKAQEHEERRKAFVGGRKAEHDSAAPNADKKEFKVD